MSLSPLAWLHRTRLLASRWEDRPPWAGYALAVATVLLAACFRLSLVPLWGPTALPFLFFFPAIALSAWYRGLPPALLALALSAIVTFLLFTDRHPQPRSAGANLAAFSIFLMIGATVAVAIDQMHRANARAREGLRRRRASIRALLESEARFNSMADTLPIFIWVLDTEGRLTFANQALRQLTGFRPGTSLIDDWSRLIHPEDWPAFQACLGEAVSARRDLHAQVRLLAESGQWHWVDAWGRPRFTRDGRYLCYVGSAVDITEHRRSQEALAQAIREKEDAHREAVEANRAKDQFLATLSHELRTPLNPALLLASEHAADPSLPAPVRAGFQSIAQNLSLEVRLIDDLLDVVRITRGRLSVELRPIALRDTVASVVELVRPEMERHGLRLEVQLPDRPVTVRGDVTRLQQVFWNLLNNALKFSAEGGRVWIRLEEPPDARCAAVEVIDEGCGMTPQQLTQIFRPFVAVTPAASAAQRSGLGLGLSLSRGILEAHGGSILAQSEGPGRGSKFRVVLPLAPVTAEEPPPAAPMVRAVVPSGRRVLLVEDHDPTRAAMELLLRRRGYQVTTAANGASATTAFWAGEFDLVICDLGLPDEDGFQVIRRLRERRPTPALALSGYGFPEDVHRAREAGFSAHLTKPVTIQKLDAALQSLVAGS